MSSNLPSPRLRALEAENAELRRRLDDQQRELVGDLQHRVRNTLAIVRSVMRRSVETCQTIEDYTMHLDGRINAIARVQGAAGSGDEACFDLHALIADALLDYQAREGEQVEISGPRILLPRRCAGCLGLAFHELATNALKFGALADEAGRIGIDWTVAPEDGAWLRIVWRERTAGPVAPRTRTGFGTTLIEQMLPYELHARSTLDFAPDGLCWTIALPACAGFVLAPVSPDEAGEASVEAMTMDAD